MDEARPVMTWVWLAVRMATLAVMAVVAFGTAMALALKLNDADLTIAKGDPLPGVVFPWVGDVRGQWDGGQGPLGSMMVGPDAGDAMNGYIPLLGFVWWFGPVSLAVFLAVGFVLARYYYSQYSLGPLLAGGAVVALLGALAAIPFARAIHF
jgi:hypothetical protein